MTYTDELHATHDTDDADDKDTEPERYHTAEDWEPPNDPYKKLREKARRELERQPQPYDNMLEVRPANEWRSSTRHNNKRYSNELFGTMWRTGEVAVILGEKSSGKSLLMVQIAESIARGRPLSPFFTPHSAFRNPHSAIRPQRVLYIDLQRTSDQWAERYQVPSPIPGKLPVRYRFSPLLMRAGFEWHNDIPECFAGDLHAYLLYSIDRTIEASGARVVIIDDLTYFARGTSSTTNAARAMRTLRMLAAQYNVAILAVVPSRSHAKPSPASAADALGGRHIGQLADSVFALARSTFGPDYRYIKHLASPHPIIHTAENLITLQLRRMPAASSPPYKGGVDAPRGRGGSLLSASDDEVVGASPASAGSQFATENTELTRSSQVIPNPQSALRIPQSEGPFLGFQFLGPSTESDHLRDYAAEFARSSPPFKGGVAEGRGGCRIREIQRLSAKEAIVEGFLDGSYQRYILGE